MGGSISVKYRTRLTMRNYLKPHKRQPWKKALKDPMPPPKMVKRLEHIRSKGIDVDYPCAPWFTDNREKMEIEAADRLTKLENAQHAEHLPQYPADRSTGASEDRPRV